MIEVRATAPEELRAAARAVSLALLQAPHDDASWEKSEPSWRDCDSLSAWDGERCVGHAAGYRVQTVVPGGTGVPTSAVTRVGVLSTHRRLGVGRRLMTQLLDEARRRGQVLASLRASEAVIYSRYGFGVAGEACEITLDPRAARPILAADRTGSVRLLAPDEIMDVVPPLYDRVATAPGVISRPEWMWRRYYEQALELGGDAELVAVHSDGDGVDDGFVHYGVKWKAEPPLEPRGQGAVSDLFGASPAVELALWSYLCDVDLVRTWSAEERPVDELIRLAVADARAHQMRAVWDEQWLRVLDVDAALRARTYGEAADGITIAVTDEAFEENRGVWRIETKGAARHEVPEGEADLATDVGALSATYLGGVRWSRLAAVGRVDVRNPAALATADALFLSARAPYCGSFF